MSDRLMIFALLQVVIVLGAFVYAASPAIFTGWILFGAIFLQLAALAMVIREGRR